MQKFSNEKLFQEICEDIFSNTKLMNHNSTLQNSLPVVIWLLDGVSLKKLDNLIF